MGETALNREHGIARGVPHFDFDPFSTEFFADPFSTHEKLREAGPSSISTNGASMAWRGMSKCMPC
jgi:hypothetical protein